MSKLIPPAPGTNPQPNAKNRNSREVRPDTPLPDRLLDWLDSQNFQVKATLNKDAIVAFLNSQDIPVKKNAVIVAINRREMQSALVSGTRLVSEYSAMRWILAKQVVEDAEQVSA